MLRKFIFGKNLQYLLSRFPLVDNYVNALQNIVEAHKLEIEQLKKTC